MPPVPGSSCTCPNTLTSADGGFLHKSYTQEVKKEKSQISSFFMGFSLTAWLRQSGDCFGCCQALGAWPASPLPSRGAGHHQGSGPRWKLLPLVHLPASSERQIVQLMQQLSLCRWCLLTEPGLAPKQAGVGAGTRSPLCELDPDYRHLSSSKGQAFHKARTGSGGRRLEMSSWLNVS